MGGQVSTNRRRDREMNIDNIVNDTNNELGDLDLFEQIDFTAAGDNINNAKKLYITSVELGDLFEKAYGISMKNLDKHIKLNNLQFNYKEKNNSILNVSVFIPKKHLSSILRQDATQVFLWFKSTHAKKITARRTTFLKGKRKLLGFDSR